METENPNTEGQYKILALVTYPDDRLLVECDPVPDSEYGTDTLLELEEAMRDTMFVHEGVALAACQVGVNRRIAVVRTKEGRLITLCNPFVLPVGTSTTKIQESSLSLPEAVTGHVERAEKISVAWKDVKGNSFTEDFVGLDSITIQHVVDHLDGVLIIDRFTDFQKRRVIEKLKKANSKETVSIIETLS